MDAAEDQIGFPRQGKIRQRREIGVVIAFHRHRHMNVLDRPIDRLDQTVGDLDQNRHVLRFHHMGVRRAAIAEVIAEIDIGRHHVAKLSEKAPDHVLEVRHLIVIPLPGQDFLVAQADEGCVIADRVIGVTGVEGHRFRIDPVLELKPVNVIDQNPVGLAKLEYRNFVIDLEIGMILELIVDKADPAPSAAGFAVGNTVDIGADRPRQRAKHGLRIVERHTADHVNEGIVGHRRVSLNRQTGRRHILGKREVADNQRRRCRTVTVRRRSASRMAERRPRRVFSAADGC